MINNKLLIIGTVWPEPNSSAAGSRMLQLIDIFLSRGYQITFASSSSKSERSFPLKSINLKESKVQLNDSSFDAFIKKLQPDIVLFDRFMTEEQFGWRVAEQCPNAIRILDTEDLHFLRHGRQQALKQKEPFDLSYLYNAIAKREIASIYRCDLSLIISEQEMEILTQQFKIDTPLLHYLPFLLNSISAENIKQLPEFEERKHFITIGNFIHPPNYDTIIYLKQDIWPLIRQQLPKVELHVYGAYPSQKVLQLHNEKEGFIIKGFAKDVNEVMKNARISLAPLRFGAGLKGKLIDAMKNGTPCVMSTIATEGMFGELPIIGYVEDNPKIFAEKAIQLYKDKTSWEVFQNNGFEIINKRFNKNQFVSIFIETIDLLKGKLQEHRLQNFTGQMLQHHQLQSIKYMSKWIEEKNKKN